MKECNFTDYYHEKFPIIRDMIKVLYKYSSSGGCCHVVVDDGNLEDHTLDWTLGYCHEHLDDITAQISIAICNELKSLTLLQRCVLIQSIYCKYNDYHDKTSFDTNSQWDEDDIKDIYHDYYDYYESLE